MSLLDLLYLEDSHADAVIAAVHQWCAHHGHDISDDAGKKALAIAVRLSKSASHTCPDLLLALTEEMNLTTQATRVDTVLIVEDEPLIAMDIEAVLQAQGLSVEYCSSREEALQVIAARTPSAAILDFHLKDGEATDIAAELQSRDVPVIFCSGVEKSDIPLEFRGAPWLFKPFDDRQLVEVVRDALNFREFRQQMGDRA
jgi:CheY-like chemotaxis protein